MKKQYEDTGTAPKITVAKPTKEEDKIERRLREMDSKIEAQQKLIDRMHRDIVRLRVAINGVAARIK